jgi:hypothetical protein
MKFDVNVLAASEKGAGHGSQGLHANDCKNRPTARRQSVGQGMTIKLYNTEKGGLANGTHT